MHDVEHEAMTSFFLRQTSSGGENIPHSSEVLERVMLYLGGVMVRRLPRQADV